MRNWLIKKLGGYTVSDVRDLQDKIMELRKNQRTGSEQIKAFEYGVIMKRNADLLAELAKANEQILAYEHEKATANQKTAMEITACMEIDKDIRAKLKRFYGPSALERHIAATKRKEDRKAFMAHKKPRKAKGKK